MSNTAMHHTSTGFLGAFRLWPAAAFPLCAAIAIFSTVTLASVPGAWLQGTAQEASLSEAGAPAAVERAEPVDSAAPARASARCTTCGIVESVSRAESAPGAAPAYELTVRMRDGSKRVSRMDSAADWRSGDPIMLIGGATATRD